MKYALDIFRRIVYDKNNHNLGDAMHRRIVIVLNSAIVEDAKENLETFTLSNNNPIADDHIFIENMDKIKSLSEYDKQNLKFSHWLLSCPLFLLYLNLQDEAYSIQRFTTMPFPYMVKTVLNGLKIILYMKN